MIVYATSTDHINKCPYDVLVPPHFAIKIAKEVETKVFHAPFYEPIDSLALQKSKITIAHMVELTATQSRFIVLHDEDVLSILHHTDAYIQEVLPLRDRPEVKKYIDRVLPFRQRTYFLFRRIMNNHPQWKEAYSQREGVFDVLARLYRGMGVSVNLPETLLEELRECPALREIRQSEPQSDTITAETPMASLYRV